MASNGTASIQNSDRAEPDLAIVLCTYNPDRALLRDVLKSLADQSGAVDGRYELIVVDNNSSPPLVEDELSAGALRVRRVLEPRQGLIFARLAGIRATRAPLICFVDDDNLLAPDYLETALKIAREHPSVGAFGGITRAPDYLKVPRWKVGLLPFLGIRDHGPDPIVCGEDRWGPWEPIGAGMVVLREVGEAFIVVVEGDAVASSLGRRGCNLASCEDSLLARTATRNGFACGYFPALVLEHRIAQRRVNTRYLATLLYHMGRSAVRLERALGNAIPRQNALGGSVELAKRLVYRVLTDGRTGLVRWLWDVGHFRESRR